MPASLTYPGVYVEEISSGVRTIAGVATSVTAFIGRAARGPVNQPVVINSFGDFERQFGGLWQDGTLSFAVRDFYLNGGAQAIIVRLYNPLFADEAARLAALAAAQAEAQAAAQAVSDAAAAAVAGAAGPQDVVDAANAAVAAAGAPSAAAMDAAEAVAAAVQASLDITAQGVADTANAAVATLITEAQNAAQAVDTAAANAVAGAGVPQDVADAATAAVAAAGAASATALAAAQAVADAAAAAVAGAAVPQDVADAAAASVGGIVSEAQTAANQVSTAAANAVAGAATAQAVADAASAAVAGASAPGAVAAAAAQAIADAAGAEVTVTAQEAADAAAAAVAGAAGDAANAAAPVTRARININGLILEAASEGAWSNQLRARIDHDVAEADLFNLSIRDGATGDIEVIRNLSVATDHPRRVDNVLSNSSVLVRAIAPLPAARPAASSTPAPGTDPFDPATSTGVSVTAADGNVLAAADYLGNETRKEGIYALEDADIFNLLSIPPYTHNTDVENSVWSAAAAYCERRRAMLLVDAPGSWTTPALAVSGITTGVGTTSRNAALFFPRLRQPNLLRDNQIETFAAGGAIAGAMARTDTERGIWKAPAGLDATLRGVPQLSVPLTDAENGQLNPLGINCLRNLPPAGRIIWGARTLQGDDRLASEWKYVPVRRTALYIEESLYRGLKWVVFEPNDEALWAQIRLNVGAFMHDLFRNGAFQGSKPDRAYLVKCDSETTTQSDINRGIVNIVVGFAPLKPAEFVIIKLQQLAGQLQA